jgi:predicted unusual protein kinase regulating ubiquinone biosynthesis (AarF/ABC1/UbiB family)
MPSRREARRQLLRTGRRLARDAVRGFRSRRKGRTEGIPTDADQRRAELARMGTTVGARQGMARLKTVGRSREKKREVIEAAAMKSASEVLDVMGNMKGAVMKLAQMASFAVDGLPKGVQAQLAQLQTAAPPMSYELVAGVVTKELGGPPEDVFESFEAKPLAAASIGQVHAARTRDGCDVVVKVQYPGVDEAIKADLQNADMLFQTVAAMFGGFDPRALLQEVVERMTEEFDYRLEAKNQKHFAERFRDHPYVKIPGVVDELSAERVLTSERVYGRGFYDVLDEPQATKDRYGEIIHRFAHGSIMSDGIFSGDPHPGNYLFMDDGRICFLDFGLVKRLDADGRALVRAPGQAILDQDAALLVESLTKLGVIPADGEVDRDRLFELFNRMLRPIAVDEPFRYSRRIVGEIFRDVALPDSPYRDVQSKLQFPAMMAMWQRYTFGTSAVLGHLESEANWHRITKELISDEQPSTEIGAEW